MNVEQYYKLAKTENSDINDHLEVLVKYASQCEHITEFGIRSGNSTKAFLYSKPKFYRGYDIGKGENDDLLQSLAKENKIDFKIIYDSTLNIIIEDTDLLFIDTYHCFSQIIQELFLHGRKVKKYIIFHDTVSYGTFDEGHCKNCYHPIYLNNDHFPTFGIMPAINLFMNETKMFREVENLKTSSGLYIIEKI
jgi:hypothetical protein